MIKITIQREVDVEYNEHINHVVHEEPTEQKDRYDAPVMKRDYQNIVVKKTKTNTVTLLVQEIEDETKFDLVKVISAINQYAK